MADKIKYVLQYRSHREWLNYGYYTDDKRVIEKKLEQIRREVGRMKIKIRVLPVLDDE